MAGLRLPRMDPDDPLRHRLNRILRAGAVRYRDPDCRSSVAVAAGSYHDLLHLRHFLRRCRGHPAQRPPLSCRPGGIDDRPGTAIPRNFQPVGRARRRSLHGLFRLFQRARRIQEPEHAVHDADGGVLRRHSDVWRACRPFHDRADDQWLAQWLRRDRRRRTEDVTVTSNGALIFLMAFLFLSLGYLGVPVAFALIASVLIVTGFTPVSFPSMMAQLFNGMDVEALLAVPFFLLVGDLMTSANVTVRMVRLSQTLVGHVRGGLAQVVTLFSMFFSGISGSSTADVAVLTRTLGPEMDREGYD